ncbi:Conserved_hypothetical protein [Hexamita inflata]|uniref:Uncharacterized protein n=1 Tax=Hexamita inflata TaxID=28002 RepID=A0AA86TBD2_9EUKA|nr:Conserved hypothetical protein [Hexamita inflata]
MISGEYFSLQFSPQSHFYYKETIDAFFLYLNDSDLLSLKELTVSALQNQKQVFGFVNNKLFHSEFQNQQTNLLMNEKTDLKICYEMDKETVQTVQKHLKESKQIEAKEEKDKAEQQNEDQNNQNEVDEKEETQKEEQEFENLDEEQLILEILKKMGKLEQNAESFENKKEKSEEYYLKIDINDPDKVFIEQIGEMKMDQPLIICLHGGGGCGAMINNQQFEHMKVYYKDYFKQQNISCVYCALRGIGNTWDLHFRPEHMTLIPQVISHCVNKFNVSPNKVVLTGFSAGGDGCHQLGAMLTDRFCLVNASAGHDNGCSYFNRAAITSVVQVGMYDSAYNRNLICLQKGIELQVLNKLFNYKNAFIGHLTGHNFNDRGGAAEIADMINVESNIPMNTIQGCCHPFIFMQERVTNPKFFIFQTHQYHTDTTYFYNLCIEGKGQITVIYEEIDDVINLNCFNRVDQKIHLLFNDEQEKQININGEKVSKIPVTSELALNSEQERDKYFAFKFSIDL